MALSDEQAFWEHKLTLVNGNTKEEQAAHKKIAAVKEEIAKQNNTTLQALAQQRIQDQKNLADYGLKLKESAAKRQNQIGALSNEDYLKKQIEFEKRKYAITAQAIEEKINLLKQDPNAKPQEIAKLEAEKLQGERQMDVQVNLLIESGSVEDKVKKEIKSKADSIGSMFSQQAFDNALVAMESSLSGFFDNLLIKAQTFQEAMAGLWKSMKAIFIQKLITEPLAAYIIGKARELAVTLFTDQAKQKSAVLSSVVQASAASSSSSAVVSAKIPEATAVVNANAAEGATGAAANSANLGPWGMAEVFAGMLAILLGAKKVFSAAGGFSVPPGLNPLTQLHAKEMVLPKQYAETIRNLGNLPNFMQQTTTSNGSTNINIHAVDSKSVTEFLKANPRVLTAAMAQKSRYGQ